MDERRRVQAILEKSIGGQSVSTDKRKRRPGHPFESNDESFILSPASFEEIVGAVVRTRTPEEIEQMLAEERDENRRRDKRTES